jgi:hypothetical protein
MALVLLGAITVPAGAQPPTAAPLRPGDIIAVVHDSGSSAFGPSALVKVDHETGMQTTLSDFDDPNQGPVIYPGAFSSLAVDPAGIIVVAPFLPGDSPALFRVDPRTGMRALISDFQDARQGLVVESVGGLAIDRQGDFLVLDTNAAAIVRVSRSDGARAIVTEFHDPALGPVPTETSAIAIEESGHVVVGGKFATPGLPALFRVDLSTGQRTRLTAFESSSPQDTASWLSIRALAVDFSGNVMVTAGGLSTEPESRLFRADPLTGARTLVGGGPFEMAFRLAVEDTGDILLVVFHNPPGGSWSLDRVDALTRRRTRVVELATNVAVVPTPLVNELVSLSMTATAVDPPTEGLPAPSGIFRIVATLTNETSVAVRRPFIRVHELSGGNLLVSGDRPPTVPALSGRGATQTPNVGTDEVLSPGESVTVEFRIGLQTREPFTFLVNVFGEPDVQHAW